MTICQWMPSRAGLSPRLRGNRENLNHDVLTTGSIPAPAGEPPSHLDVERGPPSVYPRACGGTVSALSPVNAVMHGSIPAPAGEPQSTKSPTTAVWVYPRACGGTGIRYRRGPWLGGLSPRLRGNRAPLVHGACRARSIPAPAGEPTSSSGKASPFRVYPRACGGTDTPLRHAIRKRGLSPRLRGNHGGVAPRQPEERSIPAPAGEPRSRRKSRNGKRVYPRACGGTSLSNQNKTYAVPQVYPRACGGTNSYIMPRVSAMGSIPAPAGEPVINLVGGEVSAVYPRACGGTASLPDAIQPLYNPYVVYPRACGGTSWVSVGAAPKLGLSPRLRGNPVSILSRAAEMGSIPAPAGEPWLSTCWPSCRWGLSPRLRGNLTKGARLGPEVRSIPAPAGEPPPP